MSILPDRNFNLLFRAFDNDIKLLILDERKQRDDQTLFAPCARLFKNRSINLTTQAVSYCLKAL